MNAQTQWGPLIAWYLFLAGAGAGAYLVSYVSDRMGERYRALARPGVYLGAPLVAIGSLLLLFHLGNPLQVWRGILRPNSSMMSLGIWILIIFLVLSSLHLATFLLPKVFKFSARVMPWIKGCAAVFAVLAILYTGLLLGVVKAIPFWNTPVLPLLFLVSSISTGMGAVLLVVGFQRLLKPSSEATQSSGESVHALSRVDVALIVTEMLVLFVFLFTMIAGGTTEAGSARSLVSGDNSVLFWLGLVVIGLLVPFALGAWTITRSARISGRSLSAVTMLSAVCLLIGGLALRYAILAAGATVSSLL